MSTAGKVLTVLILLVMMGWIVMLSAVAQLNANWSERVAKQEKDLVQVDQRIAQNKTGITDATEHKRTVVRSPNPCPPADNQLSRSYPVP